MGSKEKPIDLKTLIEKFMEDVIADKIEVYNEFSLQHELGIFLREEFEKDSPKKYKIQFERNIKFFDNKKEESAEPEQEEPIKREMDLVIYSCNKKNEITEKFAAIELKYPKNHQYPGRMFSFVKDIKFMEQAKEKGFENAYCLTLVEDHNFYASKEEKSKENYCDKDRKYDIYDYFRQGSKKKDITGTISRKKETDQEEICLKGTYKIEWQPDTQKKRYYLLEIQ